MVSCQQGLVDELLSSQVRFSHGRGCTFRRSTEARRAGESSSTPSTRRKRRRRRRCWGCRRWGRNAPSHTATMSWLWSLQMIWTSIRFSRKLTMPFLISGPVRDVQMKKEGSTGLRSVYREIHCGLKHAKDCSQSVRLWKSR